MLQVDLRSLLQGGGELLLIPEIMIGGRRVGLAMAFVVFDGGGEVLGGRFANRGGLIKENNGTQGTFRKLEE